MEDNKVKKVEVIKTMAKKCELSQGDCRAALNAFLASIEGFLYEERSVSLTRFGDFVFEKLPEREARNPATGENFIAAPLKRVKFKPSPVLKESINRDMNNRRAKNFKERHNSKE